MVKYFSPPFWLAFLMLGSGVTLMIMSASQNYTTVLLRLLMGAFEAGTPPVACQKNCIHASILGLVPGMVYFSTLYGRAFSTLVLLPISVFPFLQLVSPFYSYCIDIGICTSRSRIRWKYCIQGQEFECRLRSRGLAWVFLIEGTPLYFLAILVHFFFPNSQCNMALQ
ncbi:hypothetical protein DFS33DRAFT_169812 [Desarmillaria ectypa]|nr:hypothetical protein DFS33DRAFT_169812 [Desarmillaria ectypa]